jgi:hypothetical protein
MVPIIIFDSRTLVEVGGVALHKRAREGDSEAAIGTAG